MIVSFMVGGRDGEYALAFMDDLRSRLANRVQLTTDGHSAYLRAVEEALTWITPNWSKSTARLRKARRAAGQQNTRREGAYSQQGSWDHVNFLC